MSVTLTPPPEVDVKGGVIEEARRRRNRRRGGILIALYGDGPHRGRCGCESAVAAAAQKSKARSRCAAPWKPLASRSPTVTAGVPVGEALDIVASDGSVWVLEEGSVVRVNAARAKVQARIRVPGVAGDIAAGDGAIWVTSGFLYSGAVDRIDPSTDRVVARIPVGGVALGVAVGHHRPRMGHTRRPAHG